MKNRILLFSFWMTLCSSAPLNILFVVGYFPHISQKFILDQIVEFKNRGHKVAIHSFYESKHEKMHPEIMQYHLLDSTTYGKQMPLFDQFDIIYVQFGNHAARVIKEKKRQNYRGKVAVCIRGYDITGYLKRYPDAYETIFNDIDLVLPVCDLFRKKLLKLGCPAQKIMVSHSGINVDSITKKEISTSSVFRFRRAFNITTIGRLIEKKGIEYGLRAIARLVKKFPLIHYTIIGDAEKGDCEKERLQTITKELKIENYVTFCGWLTHDEVKMRLAKTDLMILPSIIAANGDQEGIPNVLKEAMAFGIPVISTQEGAHELIEQRVSGFLVPEKDSQTLAYKIAYLIKNPDKCAQFGNNGRAFIEKEFDIKKIIKKLESVFLNLCRKK